MLVKLIATIVGFVTSLIALPLRMLSKHFIGTILLFGLIYLIWPKSDGTQPTQAPAQKAAGLNAQGKPMPLVEPVRKYQNGNSRFSEDLLSQMNQMELKHYSSVFFWTMRNQPIGIPYDWSYYNVQGSITPFEHFKNSFGHECLRFQETLKVHTTQQNFDGMACERVDGGWCRLRADSTPLCGIGEEKSMFQGLGQRFKNLF